MSAYMDGAGYIIISDEPKGISSSLAMLMRFLVSRPLSYGILVASQYSFWYVGGYLRSSRWRWCCSSQGVWAWADRAYFLPKVHQRLTWIVFQWEDLQAAVLWCNVNQGELIAHCNKQKSPGPDHNWKLCEIVLLPGVLQSWLDTSPAFMSEVILGWVLRWLFLSHTQYLTFCVSSCSECISSTA